MLTIMGLGRLWNSWGKADRRKSRGLMFSSHTLGRRKSVDKLLEHEFRRRGESGQQRRGGVEDRPAADIAGDRAVEHGVGGRAAAFDGDQAPAVLELAKQ